ncbi:hypothetical protein BDV18DRAFT_161278 [Aspergillus unguis]
MPPYTRTTLTKATTSLLDAFSSASDPQTLLSTFTTNPPPKAHEHGLQQLAPFLGRTFTGRSEVEKYFGLLSEHLKIEGMRFDDEKEWAVDVETGVVWLRGYARFVSTKTGQGWDETFAYRIGLVEDQSQDQDAARQVKVRSYEVWADTGAAYLAARGELDSVASA